MILKQLVAWTAISLAAVSAVTTETFHNHELCQGFVEENDLRIPVGAFGGFTGIDQAEFNRVLDRIEAIYVPQVRARGATLKINRQWTDPTVNASAQQFGNQWILNMYGGLARHPAITSDGFALVACHEMGHHLGGAPKIKILDIFSTWGSNEGQADYYATLKCLRQYFDPAETVEWYTAHEDQIPPFLLDKCGELKKLDDEALICIRSGMAGLSVATLFKDLKGLAVAPAFDTPDPSVVSKTDNNHPAPQCRLDTYFQGALCDKLVSERLSDSDPAPGTCMQSRGYKFGYRPLCWFKP